MIGIDSWKRVMNEEYLVIAAQQAAMASSLPFVHTARRSYRLNEEVKNWEGREVAKRLCGTELC